MPQPTPARAGFDLVIRRPALILAEVLWRWCFGVASLGLLGLIFVLFLKSIPISDVERSFMKSGSLYLVADALSHIITAAKGPLLRSLAVLVPGLALLWTIAAGIGRLVTLPPFFDPTVSGAALSRATQLSPRAGALGPEGGWSMLPALLAISFLRAALVLAGIGGYLASAIIAADVSGLGVNQDLQLFFVVFLPLLLLVVLIWATLNWLLSVAPLFAVRDGRSALGSFADTVRLFARNPRDFTAVGTLYALPRLIALVVATAVSLMLFAAAPQVGKYVVAASLVAITLAYFVFADLLHLSRMAAYAVILEREVLRDTVPQNVA